jgi:hypothetical protein
MVKVSVEELCEEEWWWRKKHCFCAGDAGNLSDCFDNSFSFNRKRRSSYFSRPKTLPDNKKLIGFNEHHKKDRFLQGKGDVVERHQIA